MTGFPCLHAPCSLFLAKKRVGVGQWNEIQSQTAQLWTSEVHVQ